MVDIAQCTKCPVHHLVRGSDKLADRGRPEPVLGANEGASFSRAIEITAAVLSVRGVAAHNMALVIYHMPFLSTGIMPGGSNALVAALYRQ